MKPIRLRCDGFIGGILKLCLFAIVFKRVNRAPAVPPALVAIWTKSITSCCTSFVSQLPISHYGAVAAGPGATELTVKRVVCSLFQQSDRNMHF